MATVKHDDTYTCDICGKPFDKEQNIAVPVIFEAYEHEFGASSLMEPKLKSINMDVCDECLAKIVKVKGIYGFYRPNLYRIEE